MKKAIFLICILLLLGCDPAKNKQDPSLIGKSPIHLGIYMPLIKPFQLDTFSEEFLKVQNEREQASYRRFMDYYLPHEHITFGTSQLLGSIAANYLPVSVTTSSESYRSSLEYAKYRTEFIDIWKIDGKKPIYSLEEKTGAKKISVQVLIGISVSIQAVFNSLKGKVEITGFEKLGMAAKASKIAGNIELKKAGMSNRTSSLFMVAPESLSHESIKKAMFSFHKIQSLVYDKDLIISPSMLGYFDMEDNLEFSIFAQTILPQAVAMKFSQKASEDKTNSSGDNLGEQRMRFTSPLEALSDL